MKKIALVLALLAIAGFAFAELGVEATFTGSASISFGIDLIDNSTGFTNTGSADFELVLLSGGGADKAGEATPFAEISVSGAGVKFANGGLTVDAAGASAAIVLAEGLKMSIYAAPGIDANNAASFEDLIDVSADNAVGAAIETAGNTAYQGTKISYDGDGLGFYVTVVSDGTHTDNNTNEYGVAAGTSITVAEGITIGVDVFYGDTATGNSNLDASLATSIAAGPATITLDTDLSLLGVFGLDVEVGVALALEGVMNLGLTVYFADPSDAVDDETLEAQITADVTAVEGLTLSLTAQILDILVGGMDMAFKVSLGYDISGINPYAESTIIVPDATETIVTSVSLKAGVKLTTIIENATIDIYYNNSDLLADPDPATHEIVACVSTSL